MSLDILHRDQFRCVRCGVFVGAGRFSTHHRVLGNRTDMRSSNLILLCGSGVTGCHGWVHAHSRDARAHGWIVSRHSRQGTAEIPVLYGQPDRTGLYLLDDDLGVNTTAA